MHPEAMPFTLTRQEGRIALAMTCVAMGRDLAVTLGGGDTPHIGAVAVSQARPSLQAGGATSATTSVIALAGHKEDDLARSIAGRMAARLDAVVCVACGIHLDQVQPSELQAVQAMAEALTVEALARLDG
jgi:hypothetical protein